MLQFWKKTGQRDNKSRFRTGNNHDPNVESFEACNGLQINTSTPHFPQKTAPLALFDDAEVSALENTDIPKQKSRLPKTLHELLDDKAALDYFVQFLQVRNILSYIHCWFDIQSFKSQIRSVEGGSGDACTLPTPLSSTKHDNDSISLSTDCDYDAGVPGSRRDLARGDAKNACDERTSVDANACDRNSDASHSRAESEADATSNGENSLQTVVESALLIFKKYISLEASTSVRCPEGVRKTLIERICDSGAILSNACFDQVENYLYNILEKDCFVAFLNSDFFCKLQIDVLTGGHVILEDILYNETALFYFMEFLEQENQRSLLEFWIAANNLQLQLNEQKEFFDPMEAQNDAVVLYDKYVSLQAHCPIGFSDRVRFVVEQSICGENGIVLDCFNVPLKIVEHVLEKNFLQSFIASQLFYKYLSELINTVHTTSTYTNGLDGYSRYATSDCSSERSFSTNSTFLAMQVPKNSAKCRKDKRADMQIDTRQLYDPDSLWKRKKTHRLSLGRVTALGKYVTDFEREPDRRTESKIKNVVRKLVNMEEDSKKEEMAWQVAEMIVKDITSITLNDHK